jgi:hypothetical protein
MLTPNENYNNKEEEDDNNIDEADLIDLNDKSDGTTKNAPFIFSPTSLDMLELDNEMFQQTFNSNQSVDFNKVKEVVTEDLETLYDNIAEDDNEKRKNSFKDDITNGNDITFLPPNVPRLTKSASEVSSENYQMNRKQQEVDQWILKVTNERNQKSDVINHVIKNDEERSNHTSSTEEHYLTTKYSESSFKMKSYDSDKRKLMDVYIINTQRKIDQKIQKSTGMQQKRQKLKEGKCFICEGKGHRMKECKWKTEFRRHERHCQKYHLDVWEKWKELWLFLH